ncbi:MAG: hypothetical protein KDA25_12325 [Phycisphaerales bacterium]|nr:hypothetical protein [Phycisphaerales bacterium]
MSTPAPALAARTVLHTWWPLASSWLLMGVEMPAIAAVISRFPDDTVNLAAFGGIVFPLALLIEAPIIMMLAASTSLSRDAASFVTLKRYMTRLALMLTLIHALVAFTPLFDVLVLHVIGAKPVVLEPARIGFRIMTFWTWAIADRRFHQGLLIRFGRQHQVGVGTVVRLLGTATMLLAGWGIGGTSGIVVGTSALAVSVCCEAAYARWCARAVIAGPLADAPPVARRIDLTRFIHFYIPLAMSPLLALSTQPIASAGISRMPRELDSYAAFMVLNGLSFMIRSIGVAYNEVVVRHASDPGGRAALGRFAWTAGLLSSGLMALIAFTPLATWWFGDVSDLTEEIVALAIVALLWTIPHPLMTFLHSYYQGLLVDAHRTRGITEAVGVFLVVTAIVIGGGVLWQGSPGLIVTTAAITAGATAQAAWLFIRCRVLPPIADYAR